MKTMLVFSTVYTFAVLFVSTTAEPKSTSCNEVRAAYSSKGFNSNDVPNKGIHGKCAFQILLICYFTVSLFNLGQNHTFSKFVRLSFRLGVYPTVLCLYMNIIVTFKTTTLQSSKLVTLSCNNVTFENNLIAKAYVKLTYLSTIFYQS